MFRRVLLVAGVALIGASRYALRARLPDDWDAAGFALALERFDLASLQPHFPGYPVYVALGSHDVRRADRRTVFLMALSASGWQTSTPDTPRPAAAADHDLAKHAAFIWPSLRFPLRARLIEA